MQLNPKMIVDVGILIPVKETKIQQVGIDLTVKRDTIVPHGLGKQVDLQEAVKLPSWAYAEFIHRSTYNRKGVLIIGSVYDCGYHGRVSCTAYNMSGEEIAFKKGDRIGQMKFFAASPASTYDGQYQGERL